MKAGVIGYPIAHSKSPIIHQYWMEQNNIKGSYEAIEIHPDELEHKIQNLIDEDYDGFNVTIPHKQNIIKLCDEIDERAKIIGAVNTVQIRNKKLVGTNTDSIGFIQNIKSSNPSFIFKDKIVIVLGAGGASRAVLYGLLKAGVQKIFLTNRTPEKTKELIAVFGDKIEFLEWEKRESVLEQIDLLVNTTSLGMENNPSLELDLNTLNDQALVCDIVYAPLMTDLLMQAKNKRNQVVTGIGMLLYQAQPAFELWAGIRPIVDGALEGLVLK